MAGLSLDNPFAQAIIEQGRARGYSDVAIAAALGNGFQESGLNPSTRPGDNGTAHGGFQWRLDRFDNLKNAAAQAGTDYTDPRVQAGYWWDEADGKVGSEKAYGTALKNARTIEEANAAAISMLRPQGWTAQNPQGGHGWSNRLNNAKQAFAMLSGGNVPPASPDAAVAGANPADLPAPGAQEAALKGNLPFNTPPAAPQSMWEKIMAGGPGAIFGKGQDGWNLGDALTGASIAMMARDNPQAAAAMAAMLKDGKEKEKKVAGIVPGTFNQSTGTALIQNPDGSMQERQVKSPFKELGDKERESFTARDAAIQEYHDIDAKTNYFQEQIMAGKIKLDPASRAARLMRVGTGQETEEDRLVGELDAFMQEAVNANLRKNKGTQTDRDAANEYKAIAGGYADWNEGSMLGALKNMSEKTRGYIGREQQSQLGILDGGYANLPASAEEVKARYQQLEQQRKAWTEQNAPKRDEWLKQRSQANNPAPATAQPDKDGWIVQNGVKIRVKQ